MQPGSRVFAVRDADDNIVHVYGRGVYEGDFPLACLDGRNNPRIKLDDGSVVWGAQCWWGPEERFESWAKGRAVVTVPVEDIAEISQFE